MPAVSLYTANVRKLLRQAKGSGRDYICLTPNPHII